LEKDDTDTREADVTESNVDAGVDVLEEEETDDDN
jgi:hypothetical protein